MAFVQNILTPIIQGSVYLFMIGGIGYGSYRGFKALFPNARWWFKHKILKRDFNENQVEFCIEAFEKDIDETGIKKAMYLSGKSFAETDELVYIFKEISTKLKGRDK